MLSALELEIPIGVAPEIPSRPASTSRAVEGAPSVAGFCGGMGAAIVATPSGDVAP